MSVTTVPKHQTLTNGIRTETVLVTNVTTAPEFQILTKLTLTGW